MVSVCMITYNHENYIREAIEGVLMQKTDFDIELIIGEDFSQDNTRLICQEYSAKYPNIIRLLSSNKNLGMMPNFVRTSEACSGKYIALCEGDDYWIDPYKLKKQVDFLQVNKDFAFCHHKMKILYDGNDNEPDLSVQEGQKEVTTIEDLAKGYSQIYTASCVYRNGLINKLPDWFYKSPAGDYLLHMLHAQYGKIKCLPDIMGVYRVHRGGTWSNNDAISKSEITAKVLQLMLNFFDPTINSILLNRYRNQCISLINHFKNDEVKCKYYSHQLIETDPFYLNEILEEYNLTMKNILNSKSYRLGNMIIKPLRFIKQFLFK